MLQKRYILLYLIIFVVIVVIIGYRENIYRRFFSDSPNGMAKIVSEPTSFEECASAGFPIAESYPRQCRVPSGKMFTENIGNKLEKSDLIIVDNPAPNSSVRGSLAISGQARGTWFFEASFPIVMVDDKDREITRTIATATDEWMTENFVPFTATLSLPSSFSGKAR
jgi:hypothetical protein